MPLGAQRFDNYKDKKDNYKNIYKYKGKENYKDKEIRLGAGWYCGPRERDGASGRSKN